jgi:hypothetical protein
MVAFITVCQGEYEHRGNENEKSVVEAMQVDRRKSDRVLADMCSPSIRENDKIFDFQYKQHSVANNSQ